VTVRASKPICGGDWVTTGSGVYGFVDGFERENQVRFAIVLEFDDEHPDPVEHRVPLSECVPVQGLSGSREVCEAAENNEDCARWAVRAVTVTPNLPGDGPPERRVVCWMHLPAAVFWADQRFGIGLGRVEVRHVEGISSERPVGFDAVQLGGQWCRFYDFSAEPPVEAVTS